MIQPLNQMINMVSTVVEKCDPYTWGHQDRVATLATTLGKRLKVSGEALKHLQLGAVIHDLGKIAIPAQILNKPGKLNEHEFGVIREHPITGFDIIRHVELLEPLADIVLQHHERLDGSGYPHRLQGQQIAPQARIIAVVDVVEAITSHRPYRPARSLNVAIEELESNVSRFYDADVVKAFLSLWRRGRIKLEGWQTS